MHLPWWAEGPAVGLGAVMLDMPVRNFKAFFEFWRFSVWHYGYQIGLVDMARYWSKHLWQNVLGSVEFLLLPRFICLLIRLDFEFVTKIPCSRGLWLEEVWSWIFVCLFGWNISFLGRHNSIQLVVSSNARHFWCLFRTYYNHFPFILHSCCLDCWSP